MLSFFFFSSYLKICEFAYQITSFYGERPEAIGECGWIGERRAVVRRPTGREG